MLKWREECKLFAVVPGNNSVNSHNLCIAATWGEKKCGGKG